MILADSLIKRLVLEQNLIDGSTNLDGLNPSSLDMKLDKTLKYYKPTDGVLDLRRDDPTESFIIPDTGAILHPNRTYLGNTVEVVNMPRNMLAWVEGKSSVGRKGIGIHITAGFIDPGFSGQITLEITVVEPIRIYPNIWIGQLVLAELTGTVEKAYNELKKSKYNGQRGPQESKYHLNFTSEYQ